MKLFNTEDGEQFHGVLDDLAKARKGTPQYEEWLRKYREKKGAKKPDDHSTREAAKEALDKKINWLVLIYLINVKIFLQGLKFQIKIKKGPRIVRILIRQ
jgi:hypothetical protein